MKISEVKNIDSAAYKTLVIASCMKCGEVPKFTSTMKPDGMGVIVDIRITDNPSWFWKVSETKLTFSESYCPTCHRRLKLKQLKEKTDGRSIQV